MKPYYEENGIVIYHADCREVLSSLPPVGLMVTDPPFGISNKSNMKGRHGDCTIKNDHSTEIRDEALSLAKYQGAFVFGSSKVSPPEYTRAILIWDKGEHVGMGDLSLPWKPNYEEIYVIGTGFESARRSSSILKFNAVAGCVGRVTSRLHPTEKPVELVRYLISKHISQSVLDPFMGSGTTLRAAKDLGLQAIGIEISEQYCEITARRLSQEVFDFELATI